MAWLTEIWKSMKAQQNTTETQKVSKGSLVPFIVGLGFLIAAAMGYSLFTGSRISQRYMPLVHAAMEIKFEAAIGHLWFEEAISGDRGQMIQEVYQHIEQSAWYAQAMLQGGGNEKGLIVPLHDAQLRHEINEVSLKIEQFHSLAKKRWENQSASGVGTVLDQYFDTTFKELLRQVDQVEITLNMAIEKDLNRFRIMQSGLIVLCLVVTFLISHIFRRYENRQKSDLAALQQSEAEMQALVGISPVGVFYADASGECTFVNDRWCQIAGIPASSALGKGWTHGIHPDDRKQVFADWTLFVEKGTPFYSRYRFCSTDGTLTWVLGQASEERDVADNLMGYVGTITDITLLKRTEETLLVSQQIAHLGSWEWDIEGGGLNWTDEVYRIFGLTPKATPATYDLFLQSVHPDDHKKVQEAIKQALVDTNYSYRVEHRVVRPSGEERIVVERGWVTRDSTGKATRMVGTVHDITDLRLVEDQLQLVQTVLDQTNEGIFISDKKGTIVSVNPALCRLFGYGADEIIGENPNLFRSDHQDTQFYSEMWKQLLEKGRWIGELWNRRKDGEVFPVKVSIQAVYNDKREVRQFVCIYNDLTDIKQRDEKLVYSTTHDGLTGLPNRGLFLDRLQQAIRHAKRGNTRVGVTVIDIDLFKKINDSLGHVWGDELLKMVAGRILETVRQEDTVCRLGGDEFSIIHPNAGSAEAIALMTQRLFGSLAKPFQLGNQNLHLTASVGLTIFPEDGNDPNDLLKNADLAMSRAKDFGRSNFQFFTKSLDERAVRRLALENEMRTGIQRGQFLLHHQPKVELKSGKIVSMESLVRWNQTGGGLVSPAEFIPVAEETGLIVPLGDWILREACFQNAHWQKIDPNLCIAVNLSTRQFREKSLLNRLDAALRDSGLKAENLELEITESMLVDNVDEAVAILKQIKSRGISIAMDDFGTGYSSLSVLKRFPIDTLKIDQSFVRDLSADSEDAQIVSAIISMSHSLNLKVVAEGVETKEQLDFLTTRGCDYIQGYYFSRPLPVDDFTKLLIKGMEKSS
ncbi:MAG: EAL domain-containing protein [Magnetococcales bacterium]|nr:EAL domain-containing protein [Magnetococcales bacterium]